MNNYFSKLQFTIFCAASLLFLSFSQRIMAQDDVDTIRVVTDEPVLKRFSKMQLFKAEFEQATPSDYRMKMYDKRYENGKMDNLRRAKVNANIPLFAKNKFFFFTSLSYKYESMEMTDIEKLWIGMPVPRHYKHIERHDMVGTLSGIYVSKLFGKGILYSANLTFDGSDKGYEKVIGTFAATMTFRKDRYTTISAGLYASTSKAAVFPFFPIFTYQHSFVGSPWMVDIIAPKMAYMRRTLGKNGRISTGLSLDNNMFYVYPNEAGLNGTHTFDKIDIRFGVLYEHLVTKHINLSAEIGASKCYKGVLRKKNSKKDIIEMSQDMNAYFKIGFAYRL